MKAKKEEKDYKQYLKPAVCFEEKLSVAMAPYYYTDDMMFFSGGLRSYMLEITESNGEDTRYQWAVVQGEKLIGYLAYWLDLYSSSVYGFGAISFERGNPLMGKVMFDLLEDLMSRYHRLEFRAVSGNPAISGYDRFLNMHKDTGRKIVMTDTFRDLAGEYRDTIVYEFIKDRKEKDQDA